MTFITGSVTNANPGPTLYALIETAMLADGWTLADTVVIGGNTHKVLKSAAAGNVQALDWYLDINYPTTGITGGIRFCPFENYDAVNHLGIRGPRYIATTDTTIETTYYSRFGATGYALETNWANTATLTGISNSLTTTGFNYWVSVTRNRIISLLSTSPSRLMFTGFYAPSPSFVTNVGASCFPLLMAGLNAGTGTYSAGKDATTDAAITRLPKATTLSSNGWEGPVYIPTANNVPGITLPGGSVGGSADSFSNLNMGVELPVYLSSAGTYNNHTTASILPVWSPVGVVSDVVLGYAVGTAVRGDSASDGTDTWYATTPSGGMSLVFRGI